MINQNAAFSWLRGAKNWKKMTRLKLHIKYIKNYLQEYHIDLPTQLWGAWNISKSVVHLRRVLCISMMLDTIFLKVKVQVPFLIVEVVVAYIANILVWSCSNGFWVEHNLMHNLKNKGFDIS